MFGIPESELAKSLREIEQELDLAPLEITTCLRRGELEVEIRHRPDADELRRAAGRRARSAPRALHLQPRRLDDRRAGRRAAARSPPDRGRGIVHRGAARRAAHRSARRIAVLRRGRGRLLGSGEARPARGPGGADRGPRRGLSAGGGGDGRWRDLALRARTSASAITGIAGPAGGSKAKPVGYVCICVKVPGGPSIARDPVIPGDRTEIRDRSCTLALHLIRRLLRGEDFPL